MLKLKWQAIPQQCQRQIVFSKAERSVTKLVLLGYSFTSCELVYSLSLSSANQVSLRSGPRNMALWAQTATRAQGKGVQTLPSKQHDGIHFVLPVGTCFQKIKKGKKKNIK